MRGREGGRGEEEWREKKGEEEDDVKQRWEMGSS